MCYFIVWMFSIFLYNGENGPNKEKNYEGVGVYQLYSGTVVSYDI